MTAEGTRRRRDERGAIVPMVAIMMTVLLGVTALAVDIGHQRVERRDAQAVADMVALDMARQLDGRTHAVIKATGGSNGWRTLIGQSVARNSNITPLPAVTVQQQQEVAVATVPGSPMVVKVVMGNLSESGTFTPGPYPDVPNAVKVTVESSVNYAFVPGSGGVSRSAIATAGDPTVCFSVGTRTLSLDTNQSVLGPVLSQILRVNLSAVGYDGLVSLKNVTVPLASLGAELNAGTTDALLNTNVTLADLVLATADVLEGEGDTLNAEVLKAIRLGVQGIPVQVGKILALDTGAMGAGLAGDLNVLDLLTAAIVAANGQNAIAVNVPGLASLKIIEPPKSACGKSGAKAESAQIQLVIDAAVPGNPLIASNLGLKVDVGSGSATLSAVGCGDPVKVTFRGSTAGATIGPAPGRAENLKIAVGLGAFLNYIPGLGPLLRLTLEALGIDKVGLDLFLSGSVASSDGDIVATYPIDRLPDRIMLPADGVGSTLKFNAVQAQLSTGQNGLVAALGSLLNATLGAVTTGIVTPLVNTVLDPLLTSILNPVLAALGVKLGTAELDVHDRPDCSAIRLVG